MSKENVFQDGLIDEYPDYLDLLGQDLSPPDPYFEFIIVPQGRPAEHIEKAAKLAKEAGSRLIALCSHEAKAEEVGDFLRDSPNAPNVWDAIDVPPGYTIPGLELTSDQVIPEIAQKDSDWNLSTKRNTGLLVGRMAQPLRMLFCDDDLEITPAGLHQLGLSLYHRDIAGLRCGGFPDKSVIMHAKKEILDYHMPLRYRDHRNQLHAGQISANSMAVDPNRTLSHFPLGVYNEDWLFAYNSIVDNNAGLADEYYYQEPYNPMDAKRAQQEEFGEIVIDGLYGRLKDDRESRTSKLEGKDYWQWIIESRRSQYYEMLSSIKAERSDVHVHGRSGKLNPEMTLEPMTRKQQTRLNVPLKAGLAVNEALRGEMLVDYMEAWKSDQRRWLKMYETVPNDLFSLSQIYARLGLESYVTSHSKKRTK